MSACHLILQGDGVLHIALCDDHPIVREGLKRILLQSSDIRVDVDVGSAAELFEQIRDKRVDIVVLDIALPDMSGLDALKRLQSSGNPPAVLILSMLPEERYAVRTLKAGASGYLQKESVPNELLTAVRRIAAGGKYITASLAERLTLELGGKADKPPHELLSDREYQVLCLLASGKSVKEIAFELDLHAPTVATYRARVMSKLSLSTTVDLVRYALEHRLID